MTMPLRCPCPDFGLKPGRLVESGADAVAVVIAGPLGASARRRPAGVSRLRRRRRADHGAGRRADRSARQRSAGAAARHRRTDQRAGAPPSAPPTRAISCCGVSQAETETAAASPNERPISLVTRSNLIEENGRNRGG
jgi:hypothetical protein